MLLVIQPGAGEHVRNLQPVIIEDYLAEYEDSITPRCKWCDEKLPPSNTKPRVYCNDAHRKRFERLSVDTISAGPTGVVYHPTVETDELLATGKKIVLPTVNMRTNAQGLDAQASWNPKPKPHTPPRQPGGRTKNGRHKYHEDYLN